MTWRHPTRSAQVGSLLHRFPHRLCQLFFDCCVVPQKGGHQGRRPVSLSLFFLFDQFSAPNNGITSSPHVPTQRRLFFDVSANVDTDYWLIVMFLKRTAAIKVEAPPGPPLSFLMCAILAPQTKEPAPASARPTARNLRTLVREQRRDDLGANLPCPWRQRGKAARGWATAAHFGCCVLWLCFVLWLAIWVRYVGVEFLCEKASVLW